MPRPKDEEARARVRALLSQERWRSAPLQDLAEEAQAQRSTVVSVCKEMGLPPPHFNRQDKGLRLSPRERDLLAQIFEISARGGDVATLLRSEVGRELHRAVVKHRGQQRKLSAYYDTTLDGIAGEAA